MTSVHHTGYLADYRAKVHGLYEPFAWGGRGVGRTHMGRGRWGESFTDKVVLVSGLISRASGRSRRKGSKEAFSQEPQADRGPSSHGH